MKLNHQFMILLAELDGSFSAEHGIGLAKKQELKDFSSEAEIELMKLLKNPLIQIIL